MRYLLLLSFFGIFVAFASCDDPDPIDNPDENPTTEVLAGGDFDNWIEFTQGELTYDKPAGDWWDGLNYLGVIGGPITAEKTTDAYMGDYALRLETKSWGEDLTIPGILASGYFDPEQPIGENLIIGKPFDKKPTHFNGYIKYQPADNDTLVIFVALTKFNSQNSVRDTIATAEFVSFENMTTYTPFTIGLDYSQNVTPDSVHVILLASVSGKEMKGHNGSVLFVDELSFTYE